MRIEKRKFEIAVQPRLNQGQVLLEFAIVVPLFIMICVGAVSVYRYSQFNWQAEKEARYLTFSKVFPGTTAFADVSQKGALGRAKYVEASKRVVNWTVSRNVTDFIVNPNTAARASARSISATPPNIPGARRLPRNRGNSTFDNSVLSAARATSAGLSGQVTSVTNDYSRDARVAAMRRSATYVGTTQALTAFNNAFYTIRAKAIAADLNPASVFTAERSMASTLYGPAAGQTLGPLSRNGFSLSNVIFANVSGIGAFEGLMANVFAELSADQNPEIANSIISSRVSYFGNGSERVDRKRNFRTASGSTSNFVLVTNTWDTPRRTSINGAWRTLGDQTDSSDSSTEEGVMRKRTRGLWLIPSDPVALMRPATDLLPTYMQGPSNFIQGPARGAIVEVKKIILDDNPLQKIFNLLNSLPIISELDLNLPQWPSVRPAAYPGSPEMNGDMMTGGRRSFQTYIDEQAGR
jgi:hypothetical protein